MLSSIKMNEVLLTSVKFSAGEVQIVIPEDLIQDANFVEADLRCSDGVMLLMQLASVIKGKRNALYLGYLPYSRYDRVEEENDALSLKVFCNMINGLGFEKVLVEDCHSDVGLALLDNCHHLPQHELVESIVTDLSDYDAIIAPDAGSMKKAMKLAKKIGIPVVKCDKMRDFKTGKINGLSVPSQELLLLNKVLIVDDICDGGGTFVLLADKISAIHPEIVIDLYVTHGIFSKGIDRLYLSGINKIFAFNDWQNYERVVSFKS